MEIPHNAHVLVIDGRKLLLLQNQGSVAEPKLTVTTHREQESAATVLSVQRQLVSGGTQLAQTHEVVSS